MNSFGVFRIDYKRDYRITNFWVVLYNHIENIFWWDNMQSICTRIFQNVGIFCIGTDIRVRVPEQYTCSTLYESITSFSDNFLKKVSRIVCRFSIVIFAWLPIWEGRKNTPLISDASKQKLEFCNISVICSNFAQNSSQKNTISLIAHWERSETLSHWLQFHNIFYQKDYPQKFFTKSFHLTFRSISSCIVFENYL